MSEILPEFMEGLGNSKIFGKRDFAEGISRIISLFPDLSLDYPQLHLYLFKYVITPLLEKKLIEMRMLNFSIPKKDVVEEEDEEVVLDNSDCLFKFLALLLIDDSKKQNG
jgi:hypothetical protein